MCSKKASLALVSLLCKVLLITNLQMKNTAGSNSEDKVLLITNLPMKISLQLVLMVKIKHMLNS